jgi:hypothetical protein
MFLIKVNSFNRVISYRSGIKPSILQDEIYVCDDNFLTLEDKINFLKDPLSFEFKDNRMTKLFHINED